MLDIFIEKFPGFINCYIGDSRWNDSFNEKIYVLCRKNKDYFLKNIHKHDKGKLLLVIDPHYELTLLIFKTPNKYKVDYYKFLQGKYSQFSEEYKQQICKYFPRYIEEDGKSRLHNNYAILYPDKKYRKMLEARLGASLNDNSEIYSIPNIEEETLDIKTLENLMPLQF